MAKNDSKHEVTVEVDVEELGVASRHHFLMANDEDYRKAALTPPGGNAPGEAGKDESPPPDDQHGITPTALVGAAAGDSRE